MIAEAIQKILDMAPTTVLNIQDVFGVDANYSTKLVYQVKAEPSPLAKQVAVNTLQGFLDVVTMRPDGINLNEYFILVDNYQKVVLSSQQTDKWGRRSIPVLAAPVDFTQFAFGKWFPQEEFCIAVAALFADTPDKSYVLTTAGSITSSKEAITTDDGFTQRATVKAGMKVPETVTIKAQVALAPFRTFPECEQPISNFVFRCKQSENGPMLMLVEADGGQWKIAAMRGIQKYLEVLMTPTGDKTALDIEVIA